MPRIVRRVAALAAALLIASPAGLLAHTHLERSEPSAGVQLTVAPTVIKLWFSESPELALTRVQLLDSAGSVVATGPVAFDTRSRLVVLTPVSATMRPGKYTVKWSTAGDDGHPASGSWSFAVLGETGPGTTDSSAATTHQREGRESGVDAAALQEGDASGPRAAPAVIARLLQFVALFIIVGAVVFSTLVLRRTRFVVDTTRSSIRARVARCGVAASILLLASAVWRGLLQRSMLQFDGVAPSVGTMVMSTHWGHALLLQHAAGVVALIAFLLVRRGHATGWLLAAGAGLVLVVTPALGGHAIATPRLTSMSVMLDALHVLGASGWLGSLFLLVAAGIPAIERLGEERWADIASLVEAFSPIALACAAVVVGTGVAAAWLRLGSVHALFATLYGQVLIAKLVVLSGVLATGAYNWLRVRPKLGTAGATVTLRRSARTELSIGLVVIAITAVLVATPTPRLARDAASHVRLISNTHTT